MNRKRIRTALALAALAALTAVASTCMAIAPESYVVREEPGYHRSPLIVDVWTSRGEGAIYRPGERISVYFRASRDCYVTLYNIDTQGYVHLLYPTRPFDSHFVNGGVTYRLPSRRDPYELTIGGPSGVEYIEAVASMAPFRPGIPWYLDPEYSDWQWEESPWVVFGDDYEDYGDDYEYYAEIGIVRGDPFLGIQRINGRIIPEHYTPLDYATAYTSFYVSTRVPYPRYLCYDCHWHQPRFDPYGMGCLVFDIRIGRTWVYSPRIVVPDYRPKYYYRVKETAPRTYRDRQRHFWSSKDGLQTLRTQFSSEKLKAETWVPKAAPGGGTQWIKEPAPAGLKTWKTGKSPASVQKLEELRQRLESEGVLKRKGYEKPPTDKAGTYREQEKETSRDRETYEIRGTGQKQETPQREKQKSVREEEQKQIEKQKQTDKQTSKKKSQTDSEETKSQTKKKSKSGTGTSGKR